MSIQQALALPPSVVVISGRSTLRIKGEQRVVVVAGLSVQHYSVGDRVADAHAMVFLVDSGFAQQNEVARACGCSIRTVRRHQRRYAEGGMATLASGSGWRPVVVELRPSAFVWSNGSRAKAWATGRSRGAWE